MADLPGNSGCAARIGASHRGISPAPLPLAEALDVASSLGLDGLLVPSVFEVSPDLAQADLDLVAAAPVTHGVEVTLGAPYLHPFRVGQDPDLLRVGDGDALRGLRRTLAAVRAAGTTHIPFVLGYVEDRLNTLVPWTEQLAATTTLLRRIAPVVRDLGATLAIKTHEEITTFEIVRLVEAVGSDVLSVGLDPVNVPLRMEDPVLATERVAPYVSHVYVDDATFGAVDGGYARWLCDLGAGDLDWAAMLQLTRRSAHDVRVWVDVHKGQYGIEPFDPEWLAHQPDLTTAEYARVLRRVTGAARTADTERLRARQAFPKERVAPALAVVRAWFAEPARA